MKSEKISILLFVFLCRSLYSATIIVASDEFKIQDAIESADSGDTILIKDGVYTENLVIVDKDLFLQSENGPQPTIIDANQYSRCIDIKGASQVELSGVTVTNGVSDRLVDVF